MCLSEKCISTERNDCGYGEDENEVDLISETTLCRRREEITRGGRSNSTK